MFQILPTIKRRVFFSFHYASDIRRANLVRNIGAIEQNRIVTGNEWEKVKRGGDIAIKRWIDREMRGKSAVIVLIGEKTSESRWVKYEIQKAWEERKGLLGIHIHGLKDALTGSTCRKGKNPFDGIVVPARVRGFGGVLSPCKPTHLSDVAIICDPGKPRVDAFGDVVKPFNTIRSKIAKWVEMAIERRQKYV